MRRDLLASVALVIRRIADRLVERACAVIDAQRKATSLDLVVLRAAGLLYSVADWRSG